MPLQRKDLRSVAESLRIAPNRSGGFSERFLSRSGLRGAPGAPDPRGRFSKGTARERFFQPTLFQRLVGISLRMTPEHRSDSPFVFSTSCEESLRIVPGQSPLARRERGDRRGVDPG
jgi:hypothetical protein